MITVAAAGETLSTLTDMPGWKLVKAEMFNTPCAEGAFLATYPTFATYGSALDSNGKNTGSHYSDSNLSVVNGQLRVHCRLDAAGKATSASTYLRALVGGGLFLNQAYGRYEVKLRADPVSGYKSACLLWPGSNDWNEGEVDFPEGSLNGSPAAYNHWPGDPRSQSGYPWPAPPVRPKFSDVHTYAIEWTPASLRFLIDEVEYGKTATHIPTAPMHWVLQFESNIGGVQPTAADDGYVYIDHIGVWSKV